MAEIIDKKQTTQKATWPEAPVKVTPGTLNSIGPALYRKRITTHIAIRAAIGTPISAAKWF
jgi:murein DD-endopeptidase MepM/ murein hydrolase activator NlpD